MIVLRNENRQYCFAEIPGIELLQRAEEGMPISLWKKARKIAGL